MSAPFRSSRSRSKEAGAHAPGESDITHPTASPSKAPTPEPLESSPEPDTVLPPQSRDEPHPDNSTVANDSSAVPTQTFVPTFGERLDDTPDLGRDTRNDHYDNFLGDEGSSSLSEPEESVEGREDEIHRANEASPDAEENDSEAETERIDNTPRKLARTVTDVTNGSDGPAERTPSKLARGLSVDMHHSKPKPSAEQAAIHSEVGDDSDDDVVLPDASRDIEADADNGSVGDGVERKRKRSSSALSSIGDGLDTDQPAPKRHSSARPYETNGDQMEVDEPEVQQTVEDDTVHKEAEAQAEDEDSGEGAAARVAEPAEEAPAASKKAKGKRGQRKGRKGRPTEKEDQTATPAEVEDEDGAEGEIDAEEAGMIEEERDRKHNALEALNRIERQFLTFQKKRLEERLELLSIELNQLQSPNSTHEEYLLMLAAVDQRRDEKIRQENVRLNLKRDILKKHFVAMRGTIHGQFVHDVGDIRMTYLTQCNQRITQLQRERRYWGTNETDYTIKFNNKRSQQALQQQAYNLEVSVLSGVAKYVGFPAAPDLNSARAPEIDQDLATMGIPFRSAQPSRLEAAQEPPLRGERPAEEQPEQNAWVNPQLPPHQAHYPPSSAPQPRVTSNPFSTPAAQRNTVDINAPNGSASTIDMQGSNPPSSAAQGQGSGPQPDTYESPVLQMKQAMARSENRHHPSESTPIRIGPQQARELARNEPNPHPPTNIYENPALIPRLSPPTTSNAAATSNSIKAEDPGEQLQRAAMPPRTGLAVGGGMFR
ncbi:uncharacterized protein J3D65DRAFT_252851 [Phyllosticta citribraziliensis]|uniref:Uncharacterized protein n=1 Tax=Phyllosticta citribraziliensis TaxID=989973 RepID=A0ABR1LZX9_9PEZI